MQHENPPIPDPTAETAGPSRLAGVMDAGRNLLSQHDGTIGDLHQQAAGRYEGPTVNIGRMPGVEHASSEAGGWVVGAALNRAAEGLAGRFNSRGNETAANRVRRAGRVIATVGNAATQFLVESTVHGRK